MQRSQPPKPQALRGTFFGPEEQPLSLEEMKAWYEYNHALNTFLPEVWERMPIYIEPSVVEFSYFSQQRASKPAKPTKPTLVQSGPSTPNPLEEIEMAEGDAFKKYTNL